MKLEKFRDHIEDLVEDLQFRVWLGTKPRYNAKTDIWDKEILIETFNIPLYDRDDCELNITINFWILIRREIDLQFTYDDGDDAEWIDYMVDQTMKFVDVVSESPYIRLMTNKKSIQTQYMEANQSGSVNSQSIVRITLPLKIYNLR